jgi:hypothetical protein
VVGSSWHDEALQLIRAAKDLLREEKIILADPVDCNYFRDLYRASHNKPESNKNLPKPPNPILQIEPSAGVVPSKVDNLIHLHADDGKKCENTQLQTEKGNVKKCEDTQPQVEKQVSSRPVAEGDLIAMRKIVSQAIPHLKFLAQIPDDTKAQHVACRWKTRNQSAPVSVLCFNEPAIQRTFLSNIAAAINIYFEPTRLIHVETIEKENQWEVFLSVPDLKLVIICDSTLWQMPNLLKWMREIPNRAERFLFNTPLLLLPDLTLYLKDPQLKRSLWKTLCQKMR